MIEINKQNVADAIPIVIDREWKEYPYNNRFPTLQLSYCDEGFCVRFTVFENNPLRKRTEHFAPVHLDSCVELFLNFTPETSDRYINFEANANGVMNAAFRLDRYEYENLTKSDVESFCITPSIYENHWTLDYIIPFGFIKKYYPLFDIKTAKFLKGNIYKCGEETVSEHYLTVFPINTQKPDFHLPQFFGEFKII